MRRAGTCAVRGNFVTGRFSKDRILGLLIECHDDEVVSR
jgi:hypothetical protein